MRTRFLVAAALFGSALAVAEPPPLEATPEEQPADPPEAPPEAPPPEAPEAPKPPPDAPATPPVPPITINITNNNNGNNSNTNTNDNKQDNQQDNKQDNTQTNTQTNQQDNKQDNRQTNQQTVTAPGLSLPTPVPLAPLPMVVEHYELSRRAPVRWISVAATGNGGKPGVRASIDLLGRRGFTIGVAGIVAGDVDEHEGHDRRARSGAHGREASGAAAVGYVAWTGKLWRLDVRAQVGLGASVAGSRQRDEKATSQKPASSESEGERESDPEVTPRAEAALLVGLPLGKHLGVIAGPVVSTSKVESEHGAVDVTMTGGLRWRF